MSDTRRRLIAGLQTEQELSEAMRKTQAGDALAYRVLLNRIEKMIKSYVRNSLTRAGLSQPSVVDDVTQEILLAIHSKRHTYDPAQLFLPWMYAIARYKIIDFARASRVAKRVITVEPEELTALADTAGDSSESEATIDTEALLQGLSPKQKKVLELVKLEGLSIREASLKMGISESDVKVSVHRGILALRKRLREEVSA